MSSKGSFHLYLTDDERDAIHQAAQALGVSHAYVCRLLLRDWMHLPLGARGEAELTYLSAMEMVRRAPK